MKKKNYLLIYLLLLPILLFANNIYDEFFEFKINLYNQDSVNSVKLLLDDYKKSLENKKLTEEEHLTLSNLFVLEKISTLKNENGKPDSKQIYKLLTKQNDSTENFMKEKKKSDVNPWLLLSWADLKSRLTSFLSGQDMYKEALMSKELYQFILKKDKKFSPAHISFGLWLFFAPPISGGGYDTALKEFSNAVTYAKNIYQKYYALCCRSQVYIALEQKQNSEADLNEAHKLIKNENFTKTIIEINKNDKLFFE